MFDIIIATYKRPQIVNSLVSQILNLKYGPKNLIIVDSSDLCNEELFSNNKVKYIKSSFKAQPYQRYVGLLASTSKYIIFLDDDVEILVKDVFFKIINVFNSNSNVVGVTAKVDYKSGLFVNNQVNSISKFFGFSNSLLNKITLNYIPKKGKISITGNGGGYPSASSFVDYFPGPVMSFRREIADDLFDNDLFYAYVNGIGKGEDKYISTKANGSGKLFCLADENYFFHPPIESSYNTGVADFQTKVTFSRFLLTKRISKIFRKKKYSYIYYFMWYNFFRMIGSFNNIKRLKGNIQGTFKILIYFLIIDKTKFDYFLRAKSDSQKIM